jgi:hypothetical protein
MAIHVFPIYRIIRRWLRSEFSNKIIEVAESEFNSSTTIIMVSLVFRTLAAMSGIIKGRIFSSSDSKSSGVAMASITANCGFNPKTSTRSSFPRFKLRGNRDAGRAAITNAVPFCGAALIDSYELPNSQSSELLSAKVHEAISAITDRIGFSHAMLDLHRALPGESRRGIPVPSGSLALYR